MGFRPADHPKATTALVLGIVGVAAGVMCYLPFLLCPFAWAIGRKTVREIDASGGHLGGRGAATAGYILGIVGTVLLAVALLALLVYLAFVVIVIAATEPDGPVTDLMIGL
jgi:hypothetical protein